MKIEISPPRYKTKNLAAVQKTVADYLSRAGLKEAVLSVHFVGPRRIENLNQKYRQINQPTDVLSFPIWPNIRAMPKKGSVNLGDIFICLKVVKENVQKTNREFSEELEHVIKHSLNHLVGKHH